MHFPWFLVMGNMGEHRLQEEMETYKNNLLLQYSVIIIFQVPQLPFINVVDLGVLMILQSVVEIIHFEKQSTKKVLVNNVISTWILEDMGGVLPNIFDRIKVVSQKILLVNEVSDFVEELRDPKSKG